VDLTARLGIYFGAPTLTPLDQLRRMFRRTGKPGSLRSSHPKRKMVREIRIMSKQNAHGLDIHCGFIGHW
jgi:hypothetical protein